MIQKPHFILAIAMMVILAGVIVAGMFAIADPVARQNYITRSLDVVIPLVTMVVGFYFGRKTGIAGEEK